MLDKNLVSKLEKLDSTDAQLLSIDLMEGHDFEYWCAGMLNALLFSNINVTVASGDQGVDITAEKDNIKYAFQCKRYSSPLGNTPIQEVYAGKVYYGCQIGVVITNQTFTESANELAAVTDTLLWDREFIKSFLNFNSKQNKEINPTNELQCSQIEDNIDSDFNVDDKLLADSVTVILETGNTSISMLQRKLNLNYPTGANIINRLETFGVIGKYDGNNPRKILMTAQEWNEKHPASQVNVAATIANTYIICPRCKSTEIIKLDSSQKISLFRKKKTFRCCNCNFEW